MNKMKTILLAMATVGILSGLAIAQNNGDYRDNQGNGNYSGNHRDSDNYAWGQNRNTDAREYGFHNGYRDGFNQGRMNRANNNNRNGNNGNGDYNSGNYGNGTYNNGNNGNYNNGNGNYDRRNETGAYQSAMGPRGQYKQGYREGFRSGYSDARNGRRTQYGYVYGQNGQRTPWDPDGDGRPGVTINNGGYNGGYNNGNWTTGGRGNGNAARFGSQDGQQAGQSDRQSNHSSRATEWASYRDADHGLSSSSGYSSSDQYKQEYRQAFVSQYNQAFGYRR
ncbi:MAG: hypothetical protein M3P27_03460 [Acidobacteriota bacterium]|nr:hypothetical protein [Acidobacteriota bacterium]